MLAWIAWVDEVTVRGGSVAIFSIRSSRVMNLVVSVVTKFVVLALGR